MNLRRLLALGCAFAALSSPRNALASVDATTTELANGLTVIVAPVHSSPAATVGILYKAGSRNETPWTTGVAHQVEHMMFKGTTDLLKPGDVDRHFIDNNATTDQDSTYYYESFEKSGLESALQIEADRMEHASFDPAQLASENVVVLSELDGGEDNPAIALDEQVEAAAMQAHQYHWPVIGWKSVVSTFGRQRDLVYGFYVDHYAPQNAVLVVAGDVEPAATLELVHKYFDGVPQRPVAPLQVIGEPAQHGVRRVNLQGPGSADRIELAYHVPGAYSTSAYALDVLDAVLAGGQSSPLYQALVDGGYAADLTTTPNQAVDPYLYTIGATLGQDVSFDKARAIIESELRKLQTRPVSAAELAKAKKQVVAAHVFSHDGIEQLALSLATWQAWTGDWRNDERFVERINAVTAAQVQDAARNYLTSDNLTLGTYTANAKNRGAGAKPWSGRVYSTAAKRLSAARRWGGRVYSTGSLEATTSSPSAFPASPGATIAPEAPQRSVLPNGLVLIIQENHANPSVVLEISALAGSAFDSHARSGLAALTQEMLQRGTMTRSYDELQAAFDSLGITISTSLGVDAAGFSTQTLAEDEPKTFALLADMLQHPRFANDDFSDAQDQLVSDRRGAQDDPAVAAREALYRGLYPAASPWSSPSEGTVAGLGAVRLADVRAFYRDHYAPNDTVIVVTGDVDALQVRRQAQALLGAWRRRVAARPNLSEAPLSIPATRTIVTVIPGTSQVEVLAGAQGLPASAPDAQAAALMNFILGGGSFISKLLHQVRDVDGYVYNISSRFVQTAGSAGPWTLRFAASPRNVKNAVAESVAQMRALQRDAVTDEELASYRRLAVDAVLTGELSNQGIADELLRDELLGRGLDYPSRLPQIFAAITAAQVQAAAQAYLHPDKLLISAAGPRF